MARYKLFRLVSLLEHDELNSFAKFLNSPYFNTDAHCTQLFGELRKYHPGMDHPKLTKEHLSRRVFGKENYNDQKIRRLMMDLSHLLERYLQVRELESSEQLRQQSLVLALEWRGDYELFRETAEARIAHLLESEQNGKDLFQELFSLYHALHFHPATNRFSLQKDYLGPYGHYLECFFVLAVLQYEMECRISKRVVSNVQSPRFASAVNTLPNSTDFDRHAAIGFFREMFQWFKKPGTSPELLDLHARLGSLFQSFSDFEQRMAIKLFSNFLAPFANSESPLHENLIFETYKMGVEHGLLKKGNNPVSSDSFINITSIGAKTHHFRWTENFILEYSSLLPESEQHHACCLAWASLSYHQWQETGQPEFFREALYQLNLIPVRSLEKYELRARSTHVRILFEGLLQRLCTYDDVKSQCTYFERHLRNNQVYSKELREDYLDFLHHLKTLAKIANEPAPDLLLLQQFIGEMKTKKIFLKKNWLQGKAEELLNRSNASP